MKLIQPVSLFLCDWISAKNNFHPEDSGGFVTSSAKKRKTADPAASAPKPNKKAKTADDKPTKLPARNVIDPGFDPGKKKDDAKSRVRLVSTYS